MNEMNKCLPSWQREHQDPFVEYFQYSEDWFWHLPFNVIYCNTVVISSLVRFSKRELDQISVSYYKINFLQL